MAHTNRLWSLVALLSGISGALPGSAYALQPVGAFLRAAKRDNCGNRVGPRPSVQRQAEAKVARGRLS